MPRNGDESDFFGKRSETEKSLQQPFHPQKAEGRDSRRVADGSVDDHPLYLRDGKGAAHEVLFFRIEIPLALRKAGREKYAVFLIRVSVRGEQLSGFKNARGRKSSLLPQFRARQLERAELPFFL